MWNDGSEVEEQRKTFTLNTNRTIKTTCWSCNVFLVAFRLDLVNFQAWILGYSGDQAILPIDSSSLLVDSSVLPTDYQSCPSIH